MPPDPKDPKPTTTDTQTTEEKPVAVETTSTEADIAEKKRLAMLAMEGEEGRLRREAMERKKQEEDIKKKLQEERLILEKKIEELSAEKEKLEIKWIEFNETKAPLEKSLGPIVAEEIKVEREEDDIEKKERGTTDPKEKQEAEKMRWEVDDRRRAIEKDRWRLEDEIGKINDIIKANSVKYQEILAEQEKNQKRVDEIVKNLSVYGG